MTEGHSRIQSMILGGSEAVAGRNGRRETGTVSLHQSVRVGGRR